ncbi:MAG: CYTH domain-containing protein [Roseburia sp.]|nr:CYTH domain-containing protein [Roseburia sp.]MCM1278629.1 CYTH domain-containing protein [Robinsoniella sp.]
MEIERKFLIKSLPAQLETCSKKHLEQAYLCTAPVIRIRQEGDEYVLTYKGNGLMVREEYNLPLTKEAYIHLKEKADGNVIMKTRYYLPEKNGLTIELDIFEGIHAPLIMAEVEFPNEEAAASYLPPDWFDKEVTNDPAYHNSNMI